MKKTIGRDLPNGDYVEITAEGDDSDTRFSITVSGWEKRGSWSGRRRSHTAQDSDFGGADHVTILKAAPELAPIVDVHLASPDGTPMHALANSWYFYSGAHIDYELKHYGQDYIDRNGSGQFRAARCLHIPPADLPEGLDEAGFKAFVESLAFRWSNQAADAREALALMVDGDGVEDR